MFETEEVLKWGTVAGLGGLGLYLAYRAVTRGTLENEYRALLNAKIKTIDLYADGNITEEKFHVIDDPIEERAAAIEPKLSKDLRETIIRNVFGIAGICVVANAARMYLENRRRGGPPRPTPPPTWETVPVPPDETMETPEELRWYQSIWFAIKGIPGVTKEKFGILWEWMKAHPGNVPSIDETARMMNVGTALAAAIVAAILAIAVLPPYPI